MTDKLQDTGFLFRDYGITVEEFLSNVNFTNTDYEYILKEILKNSGYIK